MTKPEADLRLVLMVRLSLTGKTLKPPVFVVECWRARNFVKLNFGTRTLRTQTSIGPSFFAQI